MAGTRNVVTNWGIFKSKPEWLQKGNPEKVIIHLELLSATISEDDLLNAEILLRNTDIPSEDRLKFAKAILEKKDISFTGKFRLFRSMIYMFADEHQLPWSADKDDAQQFKPERNQECIELLYSLTAYLDHPSVNIQIFNKAYEFHDQSKSNILSAAYIAAFVDLKKHYETLKRSSLSTEQKVERSKTLQPESPFAGFTAVGSKTGGANVGGEYTGLYRGKIVVNQGTKEQREEQRLCLIKQDYDGSELRTEKIIGERIGGAILQHLYHDHLDAPYDQFAEVRLIRDDASTRKAVIPDHDGSHTYIQSIYIRNYKFDLWKYAYYKKFEKENIEEIREGLNLTDIEDLRSAIKKILEKITQKYEQQKKPGWKVALNQDEKYIKYQEIYRLLEKTNIIEELKKLPANNSVIKTLSKQLALLQVDKLTRPVGLKIGVFETGVRAVIDSLIKSSDRLKRDFAIMAAPRLLIGDFGLHNGNFGIARISGQMRLASLDYGAAFLNPIEDINPYTISQTGIEGLDMVYKNHFLEYSREINASIYMAEAYIKLGQISDKQIEQYVDEILFDEIGKNVGIDPLNRFCVRLKMDPKTYQDEPNPVKILTIIRDFITKRLNLRKVALQNIGFGLMLEYCFKSGKFDQTQFNSLDHLTRQHLIQFINSNGLDRYQPLLDSTPDNFKIILRSEEVALPKVAQDINYDKTHPALIQQPQTVDDRMRDVKHSYAAALNSMLSLEKFMSSCRNDEFIWLIKQLANFKTTFKTLPKNEGDVYLAKFVHLINKHADTIHQLKENIGQFKQTLAFFIAKMNELHKHRVTIKEQIDIIVNELVDTKQLNEIEKKSLENIKKLLNKLPSLTNLTALKFFGPRDPNDLPKIIAEIQKENNKFRDNRLKTAVLNYIDLILKISSMNLDYPSIHTLIDIANPRFAANPQQNPLIEAALALENISELPAPVKDRVGEVLTSIMPKK